MCMKIFLDPQGNKYQLPNNEPIEWRISGYALLEYNNHILTVIPTWNTLYELPGGGVETTEHISEGVLRELFEEAGHTIASLPVAPFYVSEQNFFEPTGKKYYHSITIVYYRQITEADFIAFKNATIQFTHEISKVEWKLLNELTAENTHWIILPAIKKLREKKQKLKRKR